MFRLFRYIMMALVLCTSCGRKKVLTHNAMYYWRTTFELSTDERAWMDSMRVEAMYVRLFDVVRSERDKELGIMPDATIRGLGAVDSVMDKGGVKRFVPVVFIAPGVIAKEDSAHATLIAERLLQRIDAITKANKVGICDEVQIDYDWAQSNQKAYFAMLGAMAEMLHKENRRISTTIRLHQLALEAPPVDRGVLMLYNTGKLKDKDEKNSILTLEAVEPYLRHLDGYSLPLSTALPRFSWNVVFRDNEFAFLAPGLQLNDTSAFARIDSTHWRCRKYQPVPITASATIQAGERMLPGDVIRREESSDKLNQVLMQRLTDIRQDVGEEVVYFK